MRMSPGALVAKHFGNHTFTFRDRFVDDEIGILILFHMKFKF